MRLSLSVRPMDQRQLSAMPLQLPTLAQLADRWQQEISCYFGSTAFVLDSAQEIRQELFHLALRRTTYASSPHPMSDGLSKRHHLIKRPAIRLTWPAARATTLAKLADMLLQFALRNLDILIGDHFAHLLLTQAET